MFALIRLLSIISACIFPLVAFSATNHAVRAPADCTYDGNGTSWVCATGKGRTGARDGLPATLIRGDTYFLGDGNHNGYRFDDVESGTRYVYVKKATTLAHGPTAGWDNSYGDGQVMFLCNYTEGANTYGFQIFRDYFDLDGVTGGGPSSWETGYGIKITLVNRNSRGIQIGDNFRTGRGPRSMTGIHLSHIEIDGGVADPDDGHGAGIISSAGAIGTHTTGDYVFSYIYTHHIGGLHYSLKIQPSNVTIQYCRLNVNESDPKGSHGAGIRVDCGADFHIRYNNFSNLVGSAWIGHYGGPMPGGYCTEGHRGDDFRIYGNLFHCETSANRCGGSPAIIAAMSTAKTPTVTGFRVYNNTFYNLKRRGTNDATQDVAKIVNIETSGGGNLFYNNLMYGFFDTETSTRAFGNITLDYNAGDYNLGAIDSHWQLLSSDPFVSAATRNFNLMSHTKAGANLGFPYNIDITGAPRTNWDRGAYEYK